MTKKTLYYAKLFSKGLNPIAPHNRLGLPSKDLETAKRHTMGVIQRFKKLNIDEVEIQIDLDQVKEVLLRRKKKGVSWLDWEKVV